MIFLENIKNKSVKVLVFFVNVLLVALGWMIIKSDGGRLSTKEDILVDLDPIGDEILKTQSAVTSYRENKLRDLNTSPKQIEQKNIDTTTTTATTTETKSSSTPKADTKTKTS